MYKRQDIGILAGDGLLNMAYETMSMAILKSKYPQRAALAMNILAYKAGIYGMIGGQTVDVINENKEKDIDTINFIHKLKTAALIEGAMMVGAILAGVDEQAVETVEEIATNVGIACLLYTSLPVRFFENNIACNKNIHGNQSG